MTIKSNSIEKERAESRFKDEMQAAQAAYKNAVSSIEPGKYSHQHVQQLKETAFTAFTARSNAARQKCLDASSAAMEGIRSLAVEAYGKAPNEGAMRLLESLRMRESVTPSDVSAAANTCKGNAPALLSLSALAKKGGSEAALRVPSLPDLDELHEAIERQKSSDARRISGYLNIGLADQAEFDASTIAFTPGITNFALLSMLEALESAGIE